MNSRARKKRRKRSPLMSRHDALERKMDNMYTILMEKIEAVQPSENRTHPELDSDDDCLGSGDIHSFPRAGFRKPTQAPTQAKVSRSDSRLFSDGAIRQQDGNLLPEKSARNTVNRSSRSNNLKLADSVDVTLHAFYLPDRYYIIADCLSCENGLPDWHLKGNVVKKIFKKWGTPQVEFFATSQSTVVPAYASIEAIIFSRDWQYNLARVFPLPYAAPDPQGASSSQQVVGDFSCSSSSMGSSDLEKRLEATGSGGSFSNSQFESV
ncbi:unnamed protein product, partial [Iphiclides podalirius]